MPRYQSETMHEVTCEIEINHDVCCVKTLSHGEIFCNSTLKRCKLVTNV